MKDSYQQLKDEQEKNKFLLGIINAIPEPIMAKDQDGNYIQGSTRISLSFNTWCEGIVGINNNLDELVLEKSNQYE